jgi:hypothetical protein
MPNLLFQTILTLVPARFHVLGVFPALYTITPIATALSQDFHFGFLGSLNYTSSPGRSGSSLRFLNIANPAVRVKRHLCPSG